MRYLHIHHGRWPQVVTAVLAVAAAFAVAQAQPDAARPADPNEPAAPKDLSRLMLDRPEPPLIAPSYGAAPPVDRRPIPPEGRTWIDRPVRLEMDPNSRWTVLHFEPTDDQADQVPLRALPCRLLQYMEDTLREEPASRFRVSGRTTSYRRTGYFLIQDVKVILPTALPTALSGTAGEADASAADPQEPAEPTPPSLTDPNDDSHAEQVLRRMFQRDRRAPVILPSDTPPAEPADPNGRFDLTQLVELSHKRPLVVARSAKIERAEDDSGWSVARFIGDNTLSEPPMRLLPNRLLERGQLLSPALRLRVSGVVTTYRGRQYLLLHKLDYEPPMGQF